MRRDGEVVEYCRHWVDEQFARCGKPAVIIVWGQFAELEELGPKCDDHWPKWIPRDRLDQYAVFDLRGLRR